MNFIKLPVCGALLFVSGCSTEEVKSDVSGKELLEQYYTAICTFYSDQDCAIEIGQCGQPVTAFSDWAQCMNVQNNRTSLCGQLPQIIEENPQPMIECLELLEELECTTASVCGGGDHAFYSGKCGEVEEIIVQNCNMF